MLDKYSPEANPWLTPGKPIYTYSSRLRREEEAQTWACARIDRDEIVSFDQLLYDYVSVVPTDLAHPDPEHQYLAVIVAPSPAPCKAVAADGRFVLAGYDLVEEFTGISAITNCGRGFEEAIDYDALNAFGLIGTYQEAARVQQALLEAYPDEPHADCGIVEIWRFVSL